MNKSVENYFIQGCLRCPLGATPDCKVHNWDEELQLMRSFVLDSDLEETCKWGVPCYTINDKNVLLISAFKNHCAFSFFKGSLINDPKQLLTKPGKHSQATRFLSFTTVEQIARMKEDIQYYIDQAIEIEKAGLRVNFKRNPEPLPEELERRMEEDPVFKSAFEALTPGRQRGYILYFSAPKQSKTRISRIDKYSSQILNGEGMHDRYKRKL